MARKTKIGLTYFPLDVDFFEDSKVELINAEFGSKGEAIMMRLLCKVYRNGYFFKYTEDEGLLIAKRVGCTGALVTEVVNGLVRRSFFDERVFNQFNILTSNGIQKRFVEACERRQKVILLQEYLLMQHDDYINKQNVTINSLNVDTGTQKKGEEIREEERKGDETPPPPKIDIPVSDEPKPEPKKSPPIPRVPPIGEVSISDCVEWYKSQAYEGTRQTVCMAKYIDMETLLDWVDAFEREIVGKGQARKSVSDFANHFFNWMGYQDMKTNPKTLIHKQKESNGQQINKGANNSRTTGAKVLNADYKEDLLRRMAGDTSQGGNGGG